MKAVVVGGKGWKKDGLYRIEFSRVCGGFVVEGGEVVQIAPIFVAKFWWWRGLAKWIGP
jgi:hypothetical protein